MKIRNLKEPYKEMALIEQERAGNERDENKDLIAGDMIVFTGSGYPSGRSVVLLPYLSTI